MKFDKLTEKLQCKCLILNDLLLEANNTTFQLDSTIILNGKPFIYEIKNFDEDYYYNSDKLYKKPNLEVLNPLHQISRSESLLRRLLNNLGYNLPIESFVIFINSNFTLYQAPMDKPIILPTQINRFLNNLNSTTSQITERDLKLAHQLKSLHITDPKYDKIPPYHFDELYKGIACKYCQSISTELIRRTIVCQNCGGKELYSNAIIRSVREFQVLFPDRKVTTNIIHDWCQIVSKKMVRTTLVNNFKMIGENKWIYFE